LLAVSRPSINARRAFVTLILRQALKLRYWVVGGLVGGGITAGNVSAYYFVDTITKNAKMFQWYEEWKKSLPKFSVPEWVNFDENSKFSQTLEHLKTKWSERDRLDLEKWTDKIKALNIGWRQELADKSWLLHSVSPPVNNRQTADSDGSTPPSDPNSKSATFIPVSKANVSILDPTSLLSIFSSRFGSNKEKEDGYSEVGNEFYVGEPHCCILFVLLVTFSSAMKRRSKSYRRKC
jgi:hypothetical protein